jgi:predicted RNA binding protein YcfA (HicA-like mRNA interferase family)
MKFSELVRLLEREGFRLVREKGSIRYYGKAGQPNLVRIDYHGSKESANRHMSGDSEGGGDQAEVKHAGLALFTGDRSD